MRTKKFTLHGIQNFNEILFDDYCRYIFDPGGIQLLMLWALINLLDLRTDPLKEGGDDEYHPKASWLGPLAKPISFYFLYFCY